MSQSMRTVFCLATDVDRETRVSLSNFSINAIFVIDRRTSATLVETSTRHDRHSTTYINMKEAYELIGSSKTLLLAYNFSRTKPHQIKKTHKLSNSGAKFTKRLKIIIILLTNRSGRGSIE